MSDWENFKKIFQLHVDVDTNTYNSPRGEETPFSPRGRQVNQETQMSPHIDNRTMLFPSPSLSAYDELSEHEYIQDEPPPHNDGPKLLIISLVVTTSLFVLRKLRT